VIEHLIGSLSYAGVLLVLLAGSLGIPVPEEIPIVTAGVLSHQGVMRWWLALPTCMVGVMSGDIVLYWVGRRYGERVLEHRLVRRFLDAARLAQIEAAYRRRGALIVFLARNVMGLRAAAFIAAGVVRLAFWKFLLADGIAIGYGVPLNFAIAYFFSAHLHAVMAEVHRVERWLMFAGLTAAAAIIYVVLRRRSQRALAAAASAVP
jgi:membrane protein DedA with SNARE-associated domain